MKVYILTVSDVYSNNNKIHGVYKNFVLARLAQKQIGEYFSCIKECEVEENNMVKVHELKIVPEYFRAVKEGKKNFEIRKNDRNFKVGEYIDLREYSGDKGYTGNRLCLKIVYMIESDWFPQGLKDGYCVLGIEVI